MRSSAVRRAVGHRQGRGATGQGLRRPLPRRCTRPSASSGSGRDDESDHVLGVLKSFALRGRPAPSARLRDRWQPGHRRPRRPGAGRLRRHRDRPGRAAHRHRRARGGRRRGRRRVHRRDAGPRPRRRLRAVRRGPRDQPDRSAGRRGGGRAAAPAGGAVGEQVVLGAAVPVPADRPAHPRRGRSGAPRPAGTRTPTGRRRRWRRCTRRPAATPTSCRPTARSRGTSRRPHRSPRRTSPSPARRRSANWRSGSSARATSGRRRRSASTCGRWPTSRSAIAERDDGGPDESGCRPPRWPRRWARSRSRSRPARDALIKKGLVYSGERGRIAFTVPHFGRYLREHA